MEEFRHPDSSEPLRYESAPSEMVQAIQRRFEQRPVVCHPTSADVFVYDPGNFWDGATHLIWLPQIGHFQYDGWNGRELFPLIGPLK